MRKNHNLTPYEIMLMRMVTVEETEVDWIWETEVRERKFLCNWGPRMPPRHQREALGSPDIQGKMVWLSLRLI